MSSLYTVSPKSLHDLRDQPKRRMQEPHAANHQNNFHHNPPVTPVDSNLLSPYSSSQLRSNSASPEGTSNTPAESTATLGSLYHSDYSSEYADDPFFGANFDDVTGTPAFLDDQFMNLDSSQTPVTHDNPAQYNGADVTAYPISPHKTPLTPAPPTFAATEGPDTSPLGSNAVKGHSSPRHPTTDSIDSDQSAPQLTPDTNGGSWSSADSLAPARTAMAPQSPRVTVSIWGRDGDEPVDGVSRSFQTAIESPGTVRAQSNAGDVNFDSSHDSSLRTAQDPHGFWGQYEMAGRSGLAPEDRPSEEVMSLNQLTAGRHLDEKNQEVLAWVSKSDIDPSDVPRGMSGFEPAGDNIPSDDIPLGDKTENRAIPGQTYFQTGTSGGAITKNDFSIMQQLRNWADPPMLPGIQSERTQPETSQAAIERFQRQWQDNASVISRAATWGTRRRSLPSDVDVEGVVSGNFLKKLAISGHSRRPSFLSKIDSLVRKPSTSQLRKRKESNTSDLPAMSQQDEDERRESKDSLAPPGRTGSWGVKQKPVPSLNTALLGMAAGAAAIGTSHARAGSISNTTPVVSPKSPFGSLGSLNVPPVKNTLRRPRSKTELPRSSNAETTSHPNLVGMLKKQGGPPVAQLAKSQAPIDQDDDDDDDDDAFEDSELKADTGQVEDITPTFEGFKEHILRLNPGLDSSNEEMGQNSFLVDRIAHQMIVRYKQLLSAKVKHLNQVSQRKCPCGTMCIDQGGSAISLDSRGDTRGVDPLDSSDGASTPLEGCINTESFPNGIPMPPAASLPAEFECQLCFSNKKFQKPSDWTKHVHEDVQPFTCTWDRCRDPKMFKRKADWVRHENEGHRHLEWWTCDFEDCRHTCYRRDNFLQHLVREHKFTEPKIKTKAAIKKAGGGDQTWQKVESCHVETQQKPSDEPCRFCGRTYPTWKKLTVHLAKHMENISLPVLKLVAAKELDTDTIISPVQDPPPRSFGTLPTPILKQEHSPFSPHMPGPAPNTAPMEYHDQQNTYGFQPMAQSQLQNPYYNPQTRHYPEMHHPSPGLMMPQVTTGLNPQTHYQPLAVTTSPYGAPVGAYMTMPNQGMAANPGNLQSAPGLEQFPSFNPGLGIQDTAGAMGYNGLADPSMQPVEQQYSNPGSVSPYQRSPHQGYYHP